jgi:hypothetical protein
MRCRRGQGRAEGDGVGAERERVIGPWQDGAEQDGRYWITEVHYAKAGPDDLLMQISVTNARPEQATLQVDRAWHDNLIFSEYFHGDNGAAIGAAHQTGWTALIADVIRRRHGDLETVGDILRRYGRQGQW